MIVATKPNLTGLSAKPPTVKSRKYEFRTWITAVRKKQKLERLLKASQAWAGDAVRVLLTSEDLRTGLNRLDRIGNVEQVE
jgi:hypothetical protein